MKSLLIFLALIFLAIPILLSDLLHNPLTLKVSPASSISVTPTSPLQGEPVLIRIKPNPDVEIKTVSLSSSTLDFFPYRDEFISLYGLDLRAATGTKIVRAILSDGTMLIKTFDIQTRQFVSAPLGIPVKLGGNTQASQTRLVSDLDTENAILASVPSAPEALWSEPFNYPLASSTVTDPYGYSRLTGVYLIPHKGTDFKADKGTPVFSMNRGVVRLAREFRVYGKTIVVDHGLGLQTFYMHLSRIDKKAGDIVERGEGIALSGDSGYAEHPHLHISVRIDGISIDPIVFLKILGE